MIEAMNLAEKSMVLQLAKSVQRDPIRIWALELMTLNELTVSQNLRCLILTWAAHLQDLLPSLRVVMQTWLQVSMMIETMSSAEKSLALRLVKSVKPVFRMAWVLVPTILTELIGSQSLRYPMLTWAVPQDVLTWLVRQK